MLGSKHCIMLLLSKNTSFQVGLYTNMYYTFATSFNPVFAGCVALDSSINLDVMQYDVESPPGLYYFEDTIIENDKRSKMLAV